MYDTTKYVSNNVIGGLTPTIADKEYANKFEIVNNMDESVLYLLNDYDTSQYNENKLVWDIAESKVLLIYYQYHGLINQRFTLINTMIGPRVKQIANLDKCLEFTGVYFEMMQCDPLNKNQLFEFESLEDKSEERFIQDLSRDYNSIYNEASINELMAAQIAGSSFDFNSHESDKVELKKALREKLMLSNSEKIKAQINNSEISEMEILKKHLEDKRQDNFKNMGNPKKLCFEY